MQLQLTARRKCFRSVTSKGIVQIRLVIRIILAADIDPEGKLINHPLIDGHNTFSPRPPGLSQRPGQAVQVVLPGPSGPLAMGGEVTSQRSRPNSHGTEPCEP